MDDQTGALEVLNGKKFKVARIEFKSPREAKVDVNDGLFKNMLNTSTAACVAHWEKQFTAYKSEFDAKAEEGKKFQKREIMIGNRLALVATVEVADPAKPADLTLGGMDTEAFKGFVAGGLVNPIKKTSTVASKSLEDSLDSVAMPQMLVQESGIRGDGIDIHLAFSGCLDFHAEHGRWPAALSGEDADAVVKKAQAISDARQASSKESGDGACWAQEFSWGFPSGEPRPVDSKRIGRFSNQFGTELTGFCAFLGGAVAQEVLKKTGKYLPIDGWIHHEDQALVTDERATNLAPMGTRYDNQVMVLGKDFQARAANQQVFLVGCGALGCEYLKGLAMMGVGVGSCGKVVVTDMDVIEISNLSRQFLFRQSDVGTAKSVSGARVVSGWNPEMNVDGIEHRVGSGTDVDGKEEQFFTDAFWENIDVCWNALDNVQARQYTDMCCAKYSKPLLESGTLGTKCNSDVFLPFRTKTYNDDDAGEEDQIAMCTLKGAPYLPLHCIEYAKQAMFSDQFEFAPAQYEEFRTNRDQFFESLKESTKKEEQQSLSGVKFFVDKQKGGTVDFAACVKIAFDQLQAGFFDAVMKIQNAGDAQEEKGKPTWTGTKRRPQPVQFSPEDAKSMEFLYATSNLYAFTFGIDYMKDRQEFDSLVRSLQFAQPEWSADGGAAAGEVNEDGDEAVDEAALARLSEELKSVDLSTLQPAHEHDFEKDDDSNFHIDFLTIATNLRAWNFKIKETPRASVKVTAGKIMPALATTTAMVCGLVDIEFCKLVLGLHNLGSDAFLNCNINLALGSEAFNGFTPEAPNVIESNLDAMPKHTVWDTVDVNRGDLTGDEFVKILSDRYPGLETTELRAVGAASSSGRDANFWKRVKKEMADLAADKIVGVDVNEGADESGDKCIIHARVAGPDGSPYEGGTFLVEVQLPAKYPQQPPSVTVVTPLYHMNFSTSGEPCPNLLFGQWSATSTIRTVLMQLVQLMKDPDTSSPPLQTVESDAAAYGAAAKKLTRESAVAGQTFKEKKPSVAALWSSDATGNTASLSSIFLGQREVAFAEAMAKKGKQGAVLPAYPHDYLLLEGEFSVVGTETEVTMPRIRTVFRRPEAVHVISPAEVAALKAELAQAKADLVAATESVNAVPADVEAKVMALSLELDDEPLTITGCYQLQAERAARYAAVCGMEGGPLFPQLAEGGAVAVTCTNDAGETMETILDASLEQCVMEDPIMMTEVALPALVEAQFEGGSGWTVAAAGTDTLDMERASNFALYEENILKDATGPPACMSGLRRMLQSGPVCTLYAKGKGFSLRMPDAEMEQFQTINEQGKVTNVPRPAAAIRVWDASARRYASVDTALAGAPATAEATSAWYVGIVKKLKASNWLGPKNVDDLATSTKHEYNAAQDLVFPDAGSFSNKWVELVVGTTI